MRRRKKKRGRLLLGLLAVVAVALAAAVIWRCVGSPLALPEAVRTTLPIPAPTLAAPSSQPGQGREEFSAAERQRLEDILRQKNAGAQR